MQEKSAKLVHWGVNNSGYPESALDRHIFLFCDAKWTILQPSTSTSFYFSWTFWLCVCVHPHFLPPPRHTPIKLLNRGACSRNHSPHSFKKCFFPLRASQALNLWLSLICSSSLVFYFCSETGKNSASWIMHPLFVPLSHTLRCNREKRNIRNNAEWGLSS